MAERIPKHKRLYKDSPKLERGEDGNMQAKKPSEGQKESDDAQMGMDGVKVTERHATERTSMKHKHIKEHMDMHGRHELEHMGHSGDKGEVHKRHYTELKDMHSRHESEHKSMHSKHEKEISAGEHKDKDIKVASKDKSE